jgi:hypothetical protein
MAQTAVRKQPEIAPISKRAPRVGAGKKPVPPDYSRSRQTFTDPAVFLDFMRGYPNPVGVTLYLYRVWPKIDLSLIGHTESNIQKGGYDDLLLYSAETIGRNFGKGAYQIKVVDSNRSEGEKEVVRSCNFDLMDIEKQPVYDVRTLKLAEPKNNDEINRLIVQGVLVRDAASGAPRLRTAADIAAAAPVAPVAAPVDNSANALIVQFAMEAFKSTRQSPSEAVKDVVAVAQLLQPKTAPGPSLDQIADAVAARLGGAGRGAVDPITGWERMQGFLDRAGAVVNPEPAPAAVAGDGGASWAPHLAHIISEARAFVPEIMQAWFHLRSSAAPAAVPNNGVLEMLPLDKRIETIFKAGFQSMQRGITGRQFAEWLCLSGEMPGGLEAFNVLKPAGVAGLIAMASTNPIGAQIVGDPVVRPQLDLFLADFFAFNPAGSAAAASAA